MSKQEYINIDCAFTIPEIELLRSKQNYPTFGKKAIQMFVSLGKKPEPRIDTKYSQKRKIRIPAQYEKTALTEAQRLGCCLPDLTAAALLFYVDLERRGKINSGGHVAKSITLSQDLCDYVQSQPGETFSNKLSRIIEREKNPARPSDHEIAAARQELERLNRTINEKRKLLNRIRELLNDI